MPEQQDQQDQRFPKRHDGRKWTPRHHRAAQLRARGLDWVQVAAEVGVVHKTARKFQCIGGFPELVTHYQRRLFDADVQHLFFSGALEAMHALRQQFLAAKFEVEELEEKLQNETDPERRGWLKARLYSRSKAATYAADKYLDAIGFKRYQQRLAELRAEVEAQGGPGVTLRHEGGEKPVRVQHEPFDVEAATAIFQVLQDAGAVPSGDSDAG